MTDKKDEIEIAVRCHPERVAGIADPDHPADASADRAITYDVISDLLDRGHLTYRQAWDALAEDGYPGKAEAVAVVRAVLAGR
jgi:hypothetical protein